MEKQFKSIFEIFNSPLWGGHLKVPESIATALIETGSRRVVVTLNNDTVIHAALMPSQEGHFILINKSIRKKLKLNPGTEVQVSLIQDESTYGMPMPEEFQLILDQNEMGNKYFHQLTPGKQRSLIHLVSSVKNTDSRINKAMAIIDHLEMNRGELDFKGLYELIKQYNQNTRF
jgi:hypothetical protein